MKFGVMQGVLRTDAMQAIQAAMDAGFDGLEIDLRGPEPGDDPVWSPAGRSALRERAGQAGIAVPSVCLGFLNREGLTADSPAARTTVCGGLARAIEVARDVGAAVILVPFFGAGEIRGETHVERVIEGLRAVAPQAEAGAVTLAIENTLSAAENRRIETAVGSPAVKVYYDVSNATWWGHDPAREIVQLGGLLAQVHFKDGKGGHSNVALGTGHVDWPGVRDALRAAGYQGWIVLETAVEEDPLQDAARNLAFARQLMSTAT